MKGYLITTGTLFAILTIVHVWRIVAEWRPGGNSDLLTEMVPLILISAALAVWAGLLLRRTGRPTS